MIFPLLAIARNTFVEVLRIPAFGIVVILTLALYALSPFLVMFSFRGEANQILMDSGVSTLLLSGWVLACLGASNVVRREIEERTTLILLSKPVSRDVFLVAKFLGVFGSLTLVSYLFTLALMLAARQQPATSVNHPTDWPVVVGGLGGLFAAILGAGLRNYFSGRPFSSSFIGIAAITLTAGFLLAACFDRDWQLQSFADGFNPLLIKASLLSLCAVAVLASFAVSVSVWLSSGGSFVSTALLFLAGLWAVSFSESWKIGLFFVPNFQVFWVGEVFYHAEPALPLNYLALSFCYAVAFVAAFLAVGGWALRRKGL